MHVTLRLLDGVGYLRAYSRIRAIEAAFKFAKERLGMRIIHYSVQGMHLHLIVEAADKAALSGAMQGLSIRLARRLNALAGRKGAVFADRYHSHVLRSRREVANALRYVARNYAHHARESVSRDFIDPCSSARYLAMRPPPEAPVAPARVWLLRSMVWME